MERDLLILKIISDVLAIVEEISKRAEDKSSIEEIKALKGGNTSQTDKDSAERTTEPINPITVQEDKPTKELNTETEGYFERYTGGTDFYDAMTPKKEVKG